MGNITENPTWEEQVYLIETTDPVMGGEEGIANRQSKQLANRTAYLKQEQDSLKEKFDPEKTPDPLPQYATDESVQSKIQEHQENTSAHERALTDKPIYHDVVIPLVPYRMNGQSLKRSEVNGQLIFRRGHTNGALYNTVVDVVCGSSYTNNQAYSLVIPQTGMVVSTKLVTFDYQGQSWIGLKVYNTQAEAKVAFRGSYSNENTTFSDHQLEVISYYHLQDATVLNTEIYNSLADYVSPDEPLLFGRFKLFHEGNLSERLNALENGQWQPWQADRTYKTGDICTVEMNGEIVPVQMYAGPNMTCIGKDPTDITNRHEGWPDSESPFWWIEYTGNMVGMPFYWLSENAPEWAVMEINVDLPIAVYWRLARRYPDLVNNGIINTGEIRGEFMRVLDQGRGLDIGRVINSHQNDAFEEHNHYLPTQTSAAGDSYGISSNAVTKCEPNTTIVTGLGWTTYPNVSYSNGSLVGNVGKSAKETRPSNIARPMAIAI